MGMKRVEDPNINWKFDEIVEELKEEIVSRFHPRSIILSGSFGRGEATVVEKNGKIKFLSDCEVILIPYKWIFNRRKLNEFERNFHRRTGLKVEIWGFTSTLYLLLPFLNRKIKPTIANYDLKYGSKVIYGKNYLDKIPAFKPENIPLWEGLRLMLNRMAEALEYFSLDNPTDELLFWTDKIVLACQDALLLSIGKYTSSYRERNKVFIESIEQFNISCIQTLAEFATEATNRKLNLIQDNIPSDKKIKYWFEVNRVCDESFRYILRNGFCIRFGDYLEFQKKYLSSELKIYSTLPFNHTVLQNFFRFFKRKATPNKLPTLRMLLKPYIRWDHMIYSLIPLIYFSLQNNEINKGYLEGIKKTISLLGFRSNDYSFEDWNHVKNVVVACWRQMRL